jgi:hypothetical protein
MTNSEKLIERSLTLTSRVQDLCHEATQKAEASPLIIAALDLAGVMGLMVGEYRILVDQTLNMDQVIHDHCKEMEEALGRVMGD